ncbi:MAG TPA: hypothetical protein VFV36_03090, partial [Candidatus Methylomirabilis sp.]|nr:hypothetical protein [Candidatus Methylomirabilis sp.]
MRLWVRRRLGRGSGRRCVRGVLVGVPLLVGATLFTLEEIRECGGVGLPLDDAWIYAALARDLAEGRPAEGVGPPPGDRGGGHPLSAATSPLWCLILAAGRFVLAPWTGGGDPDGTAAVWLSRTVGMTAGWIACGLALRVATRISGVRSVGWAIAILLAVQPRFVRGVVSGFEVPVYVGLTLAGVDAHLRWRDSPGLRGVGAPIFFALAGWARPECFLLLVLERSVTGFMGQGGGRRGAALVKSVVTGGLLAAPFGLFFLWLWGHPLPTSFAVKARDASLLSGSGEGLLAALWNSLSFQFRVWGGYLP